MTGNKDVEFVNNVGKRTIRVVRSIDAAVLCIGPFWQWCPKFWVIELKKPSCVVHILCKERTTLFLEIPNKKLWHASE